MPAKGSASSCPAWSSTRRCACCMRRRWAGATCDLREALAAATGLPRPDRELRPRLRAGADVGAARGRRAIRRRPGVRQRLGRRRRRRDDERRGAARPAQHRRRVRPRAAVARRAALFVRIERLLGSLRLEPARRWRATSAAPPSTDGPQDADASRTSPSRISIARARGGDAKAIAALEATARYLGLGLASVINVARSGRASTSAAKSRWPGTSSKAPCAPRSPSAR